MTTALSPRTTRQPRQNVRTNASKFTFRFCCADVRGPEGLCELDAMVKRARPISFKAFTRNCSLRRFARKMGYPGNPRGLATDHGVGFYRSNWRGNPCFFTDWSAYESVFLAR